MKQLSISLLACSLFCSSTATASVTNIVSFSAVVFVQNTSKDLGNVTVTDPPVQKRISTRDILNFLAQDLGYPFSPDARLALISSGPTSGHFAVVDKRMNMIADASSIMTFNTGFNLVGSGKIYNSTGANAPTSKGMYLATIGFVGGVSAVQFSVTGLLSGTVTDSLFLETQSAVISNAPGEGTYQGIPLVLTATISLHGRGPK